MRQALALLFLCLSPAWAAQPAKLWASADGVAVSDPDKLRRSVEALGRIRQMLKEVLGKVEEARSSKDVVKLNCVNEKLSQIKGLLRISEQADVALQEAVAKRQASTADREFNKIGLAFQKVEQVRSEGKECAGQLAFSQTDGNLKVDVEIPADLPNADPTRVIVPQQSAFTRPPPASPTL